MNNEHMYKVGGKRDEINGKWVNWNEDNSLVSSWEDLQLHPLLIKNLHEAGYKDPINAQMYAIKPLLAHLTGDGMRQDARIKSLTGTGKTHCFLVPILQSILSKGSQNANVEQLTAKLAKATIANQQTGLHKTIKAETTIESRKKDKTTKLAKVIKNQMNDGYRRKPNALILVPTRELAIQVTDEAKKLAKGTNLKCVALYKNPELVERRRGNKTMLKHFASTADDVEQAKELKHGANIIVATLGQLMNFINERVLDLRELDFFVIDEADQLLLPTSDTRHKNMKPGAAFKKLPYFGAIAKLSQEEKNSFEAFKERFHFDDQIAAILFESNLMHFKDGELQFRNLTGTQVVVTSAHINPDELTKSFGELARQTFDGKRKDDRVTVFEHRFMRKGTVVVIGVQREQMHKQVVHSFKLAQPYDETAQGGKTNYTLGPRRHIVNDNAKNDYLVGELAKAVKQHLSVLIFIERIPDVENLFMKLCELEHLFNPFGSSVLCKISSREDQDERELTLNEFHAKKKLIMVTTNVCSRGLDLCATRVDMVVNYTLPEWTDGKAFMGYGRAENDYIYRVGRMARASDVIDHSRKLRAISFYSEPKNRKRTPVSSSEGMAQFILNEIFQIRTEDNTPRPEDDDAYDRIYQDAHTYARK